jgi:hypothetical protein
MASESTGGRGGNLFGPKCAPDPPCLPSLMLLSLHSAVFCRVAVGCAADSTGVGTPAWRSVWMALAGAYLQGGCGVVQDAAGQLV